MVARCPLQTRHSAATILDRERHLDALLVSAACPPRQPPSAVTRDIACKNCSQSTIDTVLRHSTSPGGRGKTIRLRYRVDRGSPSLADVAEGYKPISLGPNRCRLYPNNDHPADIGRCPLGAIRD